MKKYFPGFEDSYIATIASMVGVRESRRVRENTILRRDYVEAENSLMEYAKIIHLYCVSHKRWQCKLLFPYGQERIP